jgi:RNA polymerase sigma factor (sigma-70 family)
MARDFAAISPYLRDLQRTARLLSRDEEKKLATIYKKGPFCRPAVWDAWCTLVASQLPWVIKVAKGYRRRYPGISMDDLVAWGNKGVVMGVQRFEPKLGFRMSTYVTWWIRQSINQEIRLDRVIKVPRHAWLSKVPATQAAVARVDAGIASIGREHLVYDYRQTADEETEEFDQKMRFRDQYLELEPIAQVIVWRVAGDGEKLKAIAREMEIPLEVAREIYESGMAELKQRLAAAA